MASGGGVVRSATIVLLVRKAALCLLSPLFPKSKLAKSMGLGIEDLNDDTAF